MYYWIAMSDSLLSYNDIMCPMIKSIVWYEWYCLGRKYSTSERHLWYHPLYWLMDVHIIERMWVWERDWSDQTRGNQYHCSQKETYIIASCLVEHDFLSMIRHKYPSFVDPCGLTHCSLMIPYGIIELSQYCFREWLVAWWDQAMN